MLTLTIIIWIVAFVCFAVIFGIPDSSDDQNAAIGLFMIPPILVGCGIFYDMTGKFPPSMGSETIMLMFLSGLVSITFFCSLILFKYLLYPVRIEGYILARAIIAIVGFVSSIITIISFYLSF